MFVRATAPHSRAATIWMAIALGLLALLRFGGGYVADVARGWRTASFEELLVAVCAVAAIASLGVLLVASSLAIRDLVTGRPYGGGPLRRMILTACGVAVLATAAPAAQGAPHGHSPRSAIVGLPLPDRAIDGAAHHAHAHQRTSTSTSDRTVRVRVGDSLWSIAEKRLGEGATNTEVAAYWQRVYARNAAVIGPDPDLLLPGQVLHLPPVD